MNPQTSRERLVVAPTGGVEGPEIARQLHDSVAPLVLLLEALVPPSVPVGQESTFRLSRGKSRSLPETGSLRPSHLDSWT
jgi:hypothetical protein